MWIRLWALFGSSNTRVGWRGLTKAVSIVRRDGLSGVAMLARYARATATPIPFGAAAPRPTVTYQSWIEEQEVQHRLSRVEMLDAIRDWDKPPLISIVMPVFNPRPDWLEEAIQSIRDQAYPHWELCIADDCSTLESTKALLHQLEQSDERIKVTFRTHNGHICEASNSAIEQASGTWMALMDQDDLLPAHALYLVAKAIRDTPQARLIYSDEDKIENGRRFDPYFKPDWNPDLMRSQNMVSHLGVYQLDRVRQIGGFRKGFEGSQDHDLALRFSEGLAANAIVHLPHVMYHWRSHGDSTAKSGSNKSYAVTAGKKAIDEHLQRTGTQGTTEIIGSGMYRVHHDLPDPPPLVTIVIRVGERRHLSHCIRSVTSKSGYAHYEIILIGDVRGDDPLVLEATRTRPGINISVLAGGEDTPIDVARALQEARGTFICFLNGALEVIDEGWLLDLVALAAQAGVGAVGARLWYPNDRLFHGGYILGLLGLAGHAHRFLPFGRYGHGGRAGLVQTMTAVSSDCLVVRRSLYEEAGGFEKDLPMGVVGDIDFSLRLAKLGYRTVWNPFANLYHHSAAFSKEPHEGMDEEACRQMRSILLARWGAVLENDPAYNDNLTRDYEDFSLAPIAQKDGFPPSTSKWYEAPRGAKMRDKEL